MTLTPEWLDSKIPRHGRLIGEDGEFVNEADALTREALTSIAATSVNGILYRGFFEGTIDGGTTRDMVLDIPAGFDVFGFVRTTQVRDETITTRFLTCTSFTPTGLVDEHGLSLDRRSGRKSSSQATIQEASALVGALNHSPEIELSVVQATATRTATIQTEAGALPAFDETELPVFRYINATGASARYAFYLLWSEMAQ